MNAAPEPVPDRRRRVAVIGAGIAGLAAAWDLREQADVTVFEAAPTAGGKLALATVAGIPVDTGAEALLTARPEAVDLVDELGLADDRIAPSTLTASIRAGGRLFPLPRRTMMGVPADPSTLDGGVLDAATVARIADEPSVGALEPITDDIAVGPLVRARFGDQVVERLVDPLLGGVYAGRADALSLRATMPRLAAQLKTGGSLLEAAAAITDTGTRSPDAGPVFTSLRGGVGRLAAALAERLPVRTGTVVRSLRRTPDGFALAVGAVPEAREEFFDAVVVATPAAKAARLLASVAPAAATELDQVEAASMAIVTVALPASAALPEGSGVLVGAREGLAVKAVTLSSQKWPLAADGLVLLRASVGRVGEAQVLQRPDEELVALVRRDLRALFAVVDAPVDALVTRWGGGLPQYTVGHTERMARVHAAVAAVPGLAVCGATYGGVGVPACIASGHEAARRVLDAQAPGAE